MPASRNGGTAGSRAAGAWLYDDLLAWLCPGGLLLTALALRYPDPLRMLRAQAPELTLPTWFAGAYVLGLALSPLGRLVYAFAQAIVWPRLRQAWAPAIAFLAQRLQRDEGLSLPDAAHMSTSMFHDVDRRMREYLEAVDPSSRPALNRMKVLCSLACNAAAATLVFVAVDAALGGYRYWSNAQVGIAALAIALALIAAVYRERRRQRTQLSIWRRLQVGAHG
ncbi:MULTISPECIES: hypothetical protein [unclassified Lysobacter]|uniref:hypothetical protein n=1 Tax=unclassified Lysobacter TaxID=2635362 RepID=UPI0006F59C59|nr:MULTISPECIES: hypothetical protein [unclassified Lysobacter]KQZ55915.1 hypothetical protein ASD53_13795 [Lysobacter sp. Root559]KRC32016.1 hypothetical protein ASE10_15725 [Lysobacter sp. Root76]KRD67480.1 hypothetical protein ASE45_11900 [Lysobacter sp. Root96]